MNYFITPDLNNISGGNKYDQNILSYLYQIGFKVKNIYPSSSSLTMLNFLNTIYKIPNDSIIIIDGLIAAKMYSVFNNLVKKYRVIILIHHPVSYERKKYGDIVLKLKERKIFSEAHSLITVSKTMKKTVQRMLNNKKFIDVVHPGVDEEYFKNNHEKKQGYNLICVGSIIPRKNIESCIKTLSYLDEKWNLSIVGKYKKSDPYTHSLHNLIDDLNLGHRVKFLGQIKDNNNLIKILLNSQIYICLSHYEGYGMANVEAATLGLPLVVSDLPVFRENLKGFKRKYVNVDNCQEIAKAIEDLFEDQTVRLNERSSRWKEVGFKFKQVLDGQ